MITPGQAFVLTSLNSVEALPDHGDDGAAGHVLDKPGEERLLGQVGVVLLKVSHGSLGI